MLATSFLQIWSLSDFSVVQVTSVEKRESWEHFSPSAYGLGFKKYSLDSLFSTLVTWTTHQSDEDKFVRRLGSTIIETKYYFSIVKIFFPKSVQGKDDIIPEQKTVCAKVFDH